MSASFVEQPYQLYSPEDHRSWSLLYSRMKPQWEKYANDHFLKGISTLGLTPDRVPRLEEVNRFLKPLTGFQAKGVGGYVPAFVFFDCLRHRSFPTTVNIRHADQLDYLRTGHFSRHRRSCSHAHRPGVCRGSGPLR